MLERGKRERLPKQRESVHYEITLGEQKIHIGLGFYDDWRLGEVWADMAKVGATLQAVFHAWSISISKALQYGVPVRDLLDSYCDVSTPIAPKGVLLCSELPSIHKKMFKSPWQAIATLLLDVTDKDGRFKG